MDVVQYLRAPQDELDFGLLLAGLQVSTGRDSVQFGPFALNLSASSDPTLVLAIHLEKIDLRTNSTSPFKGKVWAEFQENRPFPVQLNGANIAEAEITDIHAGEGEPVAWGRDGCTDPGSELTPVPWNGPVPPEDGDAGYPFPLRDAYDVLMNVSEPARSFAEENPDHRVCRATYEEIRPVVPPWNYEWMLTLCQGSNAYDALVRRSETPLGVQDSIAMEAPATRGAPAPRWLMPATVIPLNHLYGEGMSKLGWLQDAQQRFNFVFDASSNVTQVVRLRETGALGSNLVTASFIRDGFPTYELDPASGKLLTITTSR